MGLVSDTQDRFPEIKKWLEAGETLSAACIKAGTTSRKARAYLAGSQKEVLKKIMTENRSGKKQEETL